jgi:uncharacterized protein YecT (DUF1311 family)
MTLFARTMIGALLALVATASGAAAQDCADSDSTTDMARCYTKLLDKANADMQAKYQEVDGPVKHLSMLDGGLSKAQEAWVTYRDQTCELARIYALESQLETINALSCKLVLTRERISDLDNQFHPMFDAKH